LRAGLHLKKAFGARKLGEVSADDIELYLLRRLQDRVRIKTGAGVVLREKLKPATVHQELRILRRVLNVAVRKKLLPSNPCAGVEFPVAVKGLFGPHYMGWAEQQQIEFQAPEYIRNIIRIITDTLLRVYKELMQMKKDQVNLENAVVWIPDSKTENGVAEVPLTELGGFPEPTVAGHTPTVRLASAGPLRVLVFLGRVHLYEGLPPATVVHGGLIDTDMNPADGPGSDFLSNVTALGRYGTADDIAATVAHLAGDGGSYASGTAITIDGGFAA